MDAYGATTDDLSSFLLARADELALDDEQRDRIYTQVAEYQNHPDGDARRRARKLSMDFADHPDWRPSWAVWR